MSEDAVTAPPTTTQRTRRLTKAAFLYPLKGIIYFVRNPQFYPLLRGRIVPCIVLSTVVYATLFIWTYLPQVAFLALFHSKGSAWLNATFLVLGEGAAITALLFEAFFVDECLVDVFDAVLVAEGLGPLVETMRPVDRDTENPVKALGKPHRSSVYSPFSFRQILEFIIFLPLNFVPWVGVPLFLWLTGYRAGPLQHYRYFKLRDLPKKEKKEFVKRRRLHYTGFGCVHLLLQLVPVLSMFFLLTTAAGSALWAAQLHKEENGVAVPADPPPEYSDAV